MRYLYVILCDALFFQEGYRVLVTGHSLGAGVGAVLTMLIQNEHKEWSKNLHAYLFSTPGAVCKSVPHWGRYTYSIIIIIIVVLCYTVNPDVCLRL